LSPSREHGYSAVGLAQEGTTMFWKTAGFWKTVGSAGLVALFAATVIGSAPADAASQKKKKIGLQPVGAEQATGTHQGSSHARSWISGPKCCRASANSPTTPIPPGYSPTAVIDNTAFSHRSPLPGPFDLPSRRNPYPWNFCVGC